MGYLPPSRNVFIDWFEKLPQVIDLPLERSVQRVTSSYLVNLKKGEKIELHCTPWYEGPDKIGLRRIYIFRTKNPKSLQSLLNGKKYELAGEIIFKGRKAYIFLQENKPIF